MTSNYKYNGLRIPLDIPDGLSDVSIEEYNLIVDKFEEILPNIKVPFTSEEEDEMRRAFEYAFRAHSKQRRKSGEPYILHPIEVARICATELGLGHTSITSALLHDVVEDTTVTLDMIEKEFGERVAMIVEGLTKFSDFANVRDKVIASPQAENFKKVLLTISKDVRVVLIKMADRLHNMRTLGSMPQHKQLKIASETSYIYAPLAHRLGFYSIKTELEDLVMKIVDAEQYQYIVQKLQDTQTEREKYIESFISPLKNDLDKEGFHYKIYGRAKSISSINNKLKNKLVPFEEIYDLFAIRVILDVPFEKEKAGCWNVYSIITDNYTPVPERLKDWISMPKSNGYESLHTTVMGPKGRFVEVQIRSERMDEMAEMGYAAHWKYKGINHQDSILENWLTKARELLENPNHDAIDFLNDFKSSLFSEEVYVFTPKGELRFLPKGATALDFAFDIHSQVGYHCKAVKVDQRIVPLSYELKNGEQISVITSNTQKPSDDWLKIVKTGKARSKIRQALKEEKIYMGSLGKEILERKLKSIKADFDEKNLDFLTKFYNYGSRLDLYLSIYLEQLNLTELKTIKIEHGKFVNETTREIQHDEITGKQTELFDKSQFKEFNTSRKQFQKPKLLIDGEDASTYVYSLSSCCNPVLGDDVFAYITSKHGIKIHRTTCDNAEYLQATYGYRVKKAEWVETVETSFITELLITGMDDMGVISRLSDVLANKMKVNIKSFAMTGSEGHFEGRIGVEVQNKEQLDSIINELKSLEVVNTVSRVT
jgi:GTP diphosphokinase / guanosine-3',5'-bis(diphosphate) 3'-diphosphatase